jgi:hypothetical protein
MGCNPHSEGENMRRREFVKLLSGTAAAWSRAAHAENTARLALRARDYSTRIGAV